MSNYQLLGFLHVLEGIALITLGSLAIVHLAKWSYFSIPIISGVVVSIMCTRFPPTIYLDIVIMLMKLV